MGSDRQRAGPQRAHAPDAFGGAAGVLPRPRRPHDQLLRAPMATLQTLLAGRAFLEGPRWRDGALYVSDMHAHEVLRISADGATEVLVQLDTAPSGLGWLPD